jgi:hypothetical protein
MFPRHSILLFLLASSAAFPAIAQETPPAETPAQSAAAGPEEELQAEDDGQEIVVVGQKPRGSVVGDIPPENVLTTRDIRATGATSISELLDAVASQTGSARGRSAGRPILLLNGQRISGFRELRDLPPEAIERMEILPEEVALKYGYAADQRVVNIVLRRRFNSTSTEARGRVATEGGYYGGQGDATRLIIAEGTRTSLNAHIESNSALYESERDIVLEPIPSQPEPVDPRPFTTLVGRGTDVRLSGTHNRTILSDVSATLNAEAERQTSQSRFGVPTATLNVDDTEILRAFPNDPLTRDFTNETFSLGSALNGQKGKWRWSSTGNAELSRNTTHTDRGFDLDEIQVRLDAGEPIDPLGDLGPLDEFARDHSRSTRHTLALDGTATGPLFSLPAGDATATFRIGVGSTGIDSEATTQGIKSEADLHRNSGVGSVNVDLPITKRSASIGRLTANANAAVTQLSDAGTLTALGAGLSWAPASKLNFTASWTREEGAPSLQQLGDPLIETPNVNIFDFVTGESVEVTVLTGGNPDLRSDTRNVFKIGGNWQPFEKTDLRLRAEYVRQTIDDPQASFPAASQAIQEAFPERFVRSGPGCSETPPDLTSCQLVAVDYTPVNFQQSRMDTIRLGFDFTKPLQSKPPSQAAIASFRQRFAGQQGQETPPAGAGGPPPGPPPEGAGPGGGGFRGFGGGRFGGRQGGRLTFSLTDQITLVDTVTIANGVPKLDYLHGEAIGRTGGQPRHEIQFETGYYNNGYGARLRGNWRSGTTVESSTGDLKFSPYADIDFRLFANLGENFDLVSKHPFFRGASVQFNVENIFNNKPRVRDASGETPINYQPDLLEPIGRTVGITFRKLFIPQRFFQRGGGRRPGG